MRAYCAKCEEYRTDDGNDAWGFIWYATSPICQRCAGVVEIINNSHEEPPPDFVEDDGDELVGA